jgi:hypothetical protein
VGRQPVRGRTPDGGLRLNFRGAPLWQILNYLGAATGFIINAKPNVEIGVAMDAWSDKPLEKEEALNLEFTLSPGTARPGLRILYGVCGKAGRRAPRPLKASR